jgi:uncharacterized delta-60 repeat protein
MDAAGNADQSFGLNGSITMHDPDLASNELYALALNSHKDIFAGLDKYHYFAAYKRDSSGNQDNNFGTNGNVAYLIPGSTRNYAFAIDGDDRILLAGAADKQIGITRHLPDGHLDSTFGNNGLVTSQVTGSRWGDYATGIALLPNGKILICGQTGMPSPGNYDFILARYLSNGRLDSTFGDHGFVRTDFGFYDVANDIVVQPDGRIVITGVANYDALVVARYLPEGALDTSFNHTGYLVKDHNGLPLRGSKIILQADHKIIVGGSAYLTPSGQDRDFAVFRCLPDGRADEGFAPGGLYTMDFSNGGDDALMSMALQSDGKLLLGGSGTDGALMIRLNTRSLNVPTVPKSTIGYNIFPNPASNILNITRRKGTGTATLFITDIAGRSVLNRSDIVIGNNPYVINTTPLASGQYVVHVQDSDGGFVSEKISIKH